MVDTDRSEVFPLIAIVIILGIYTVILGTCLTVFVLPSSLSHSMPTIPGYNVQANNTYYPVNGGAQDGQLYFNYTNSYNDDNLVYFDVAGDGSDISVRFFSFDPHYNPNHVMFVFDQTWGWWDGARIEMDTNEVFGYYNEELNIIQFDVSLKRNFHITLYPDIDTDIKTDLLTKDNFKITVGELTEDAVKANVNTGNALSIIFQMMTFSVPNISPGLQFLIAIPIDTVMAYLLFRFITMFIPLIPGGG